MRESVVLLALVAACTTAAQYDGPRLPRAEVAHVKGDGTRIDTMDDDRVENNSIEVLPGEHEMEVAMDAAMIGGYSLVSAHDLTVCFRAFAGRLYQVRPAASIPYVHNHWRPAVFDYQAEVYVDHPCPAKRPLPAVVPSPMPAKKAEESGPPAPPVPQARDSE